MYTIIREYQMDEKFETIDDARNQVKASIDGGTQSDMYIVELVEAYKITVPVDVKIFNREEIREVLNAPLSKAISISN